MEMRQRQNIGTFSHHFFFTKSKNYAKKKGLYSSACACVGNIVFFLSLFLPKIVTSLLFVYIYSYTLFIESVTILSFLLK